MQQSSKVRPMTNACLLRYIYDSSSKAKQANKYNLYLLSNDDFFAYNHKWRTSILCSSPIISYYLFDCGFTHKWEVLKF